MAFDPLRIEDVRRDTEPVERLRIVEKQPIFLPVRIEERQKSNEPEASNEKPADSKKDFEIEPETKKEFYRTKGNFEPAEPVSSEPPEEEDDSSMPVFDRKKYDRRWRIDEQIRELVLWRWEFKCWPGDLEDKVNHPTGLESYYELRYFSEGTNRKGEKYAELYAKHRAKRDFWIDEECQKRATGQTDVDASAADSNVVHLATRWASGSN